MVHADLSWDWEALRVRCLKEARSMGGSSADAEDIVQEALTRAWRMRHQCHDDRRPTPWVLQITRNEALRHHGRRSDYPVDPQLEKRREPSTPGLDPVLDRIVMTAAMRTLAKDDQTVLMLRYARDLSQPGVAIVLGVPEGTVKVRLHRARARLRTAMNGR